MNYRISSSNLALAMMAGLALSTPAMVVAAENEQRPAHAEAAADAAEIIVTADYRTEATAGGTRIMTALKDLPMSVAVVNEDLIRDMGARKIEDAVRFVSGINKVNRNDNLGRGERFAIRGFNSGLVLRNGVPYNVFSDTANIQQIDIIKGANSVLYGFNDPGGLINFITRAPQADFSATLSQAIGSYDYYRTEADVTGRLLGDVNMRLMGSYTDAGSHLKHGMERSIFINPVLDIGLTPSTRLLIDYEYRRQKSRGARNGYPTIIGADGSYLGYVDLGSRFSNLFPQSRNVNEVQNIDIRLTQEIGDDVTLRVVGARTSIEADQFNAMIDNLLPGQPTITRTRMLLELPTQRTDLVFADLSAKFDFAGMEHKVIVGFQHQKRTGTSASAFSTFNAPWNIYDWAANPNRAYEVPATYDQVLSLVTRRASAPSKSTGFFFTDQISINDRVHILAGGRFDRLNGVSRFTPQIGANVRINNAISAYALYSESFRLNASYTYQDTGEVVTFPPEIGANKEIGLKLDLFDRRLAATVAVFELERKNVLQMTASSNPQRPFINLSGGEVSRGLEIDISGQIGPHLSLFGSYAYTDTEVKSSTNAAVVGAPLEGVAKHAFSMFAKLDLGQVGPGKVLINGGMLYRDGPILLLNNVAANSAMSEGSYLVFDGGIDYALPGKLTFSIKATNLNNEKYMDRRSAYAAPRQVFATVRKEF